MNRILYNKQQQLAKQVRKQKTFGFNSRLYCFIVEVTIVFLVVVLQRKSVAYGQKLLLMLRYIFNHDLRHFAISISRETKVYQESRELQEREALVSPVQR